MRIVAIGLAVGLLVCVSIAQGQYYGGYVDNSASTVGESYARGLSDMTRSASVANLNNSEAAINMTEAARRDMENQQQWTDTYFKMRDSNRQYRAQERGPRASMEDAVRYAQLGKPAPLSPSDLDTVDGAISWPMLLKSPQYADYRAQLESLYSKRATFGGITGDDYFQINRTTQAMLEGLKSHVRDVPPEEYMAARRFIESLAYEARRPAG